MSYEVDLRTHYRAVHERLWPTPKPAPKPVLAPVEPEPPPEPVAVVSEPPPPPPAPIKIGWRRIITVVSNYYHLHSDELLANGRQQHHAHARHVAWYLMHRDGLSYPVIGRLCNRNHSSIVKACQHLEIRLAGSYQLAVEITELEQELCRLRLEVGRGSVEQAQG